MDISKRIRLHGAFSGEPTGERNGAYKHGRYTCETRELGRTLRQMAKTADVKTATVMKRAWLAAAQCDSTTRSRQAGVGRGCHQG
jgi:hypothetical protein